MGTGSFPEVQRPGRGVDHPPPSSTEIKTDYSYTSTPPLAFRGLFYRELYFYLIFGYYKQMVKVNKRPPTFYFIIPSFKLFLYLYA